MTRISFSAVLVAESDGIMSPSTYMVERFMSEVEKASDGRIKASAPASWRDSWVLTIKVTDPSDNMSLCKPRRRK